MREHPIVVAGAGPVGLALALALRRAGHDCLLLDGRDRGAAQRDARVLAVSHGSRQLLERLGVWPALRPTPIRRIHVSHRGHFGRTLIEADDYRLPALGYVLPAAELVAALADRACREGLSVEYDSRVTQVAGGAGDAIVTVETCGDRSLLRARLVAHAEGAAGEDAALVVRDYGQQAVVAVVRSDPPAADLAYERFTAAGPVALLPLAGSYALVFTAGADAAAALARLAERAFLDRLQEQFGDRMVFTGAEARSLFPLVLRYRRRSIARREVWLGNAAQTLHPVAGQGFNLALRDVWSLAEVLAGSPADDPGDAACLAAYARSRALDRGGVIGLTDALVRVFGSDAPPVAAARAGGLLALDLLPPLRGFFAGRMMFGTRGL